jgi:hypothetical protein
MPLVAISGYAFADMEISAPEFLRLATRPGATRCLRKPFKPATSPGVIDECLSEAESHRRHVTALAAVAAAQARSKSPDATALMRSHAPSCAVLRRRRKATQFEE